MDKNAPHDQPLGRLARFGHTAHGLYSTVDGLIETAGGVSIPIPGIVPDSSDCHLIRPPGSRPDTRTAEEVAADTAAGRTWLDYGIVSGLNHRLYGKSLNLPGSPGWIYCAPDGSKWLARFLLANSTTVRLTFRRFGTISRSASDTNIVQTVDVPISGIGANGEYPVVTTIAATDAKAYRFDAVSATGGKFLFTGRQRVWAAGGVDGSNTPPLGISTATNGVNNAAGPAGGAWEIVITGTPPAASATCTPLIHPRSGTAPAVQVPFAAWEEQTTSLGGGQYETTIVYKGNGLSAPGQTPIGRAEELFPGVSSIITRPVGAHTYTHDERWLAGGYYDDDDNLQLVTALLHYTCEVVFALTPVPHTHTLAEGRSYGGSGSYSITVDGEVTFSCRPMNPIPVSGTAGFTFEFSGRLLNDYDAMPFGSGSTTGASTGASFTVGSPGWTVTGDSIKSTSSGGAAQIAQAISGLTYGRYGWVDEFRTMWPIRLHTIRFANRCWGLIAEAATSGPQNGTAVVAAYVSPEQFVTDMIDVATVDGIGYASAHPVTGEIAYSTHRFVCWV